MEKKFKDGYVEISRRSVEISIRGMLKSAGGLLKSAAHRTKRELNTHRTKRELKEIMTGINAHVRFCSVSQKG